MRRELIALLNYDLQSVILIHYSFGGFSTHFYSAVFFYLQNQHNYQSFYFLCLTRLASLNGNISHCLDSELFNVHYHINKNYLISSHLLSFLKYILLMIKQQIQIYFSLDLFSLIEFPQQFSFKTSNSHYFHGIIFYRPFSHIRLKIPSIIARFSLYYISYVSYLKCTIISTFLVLIQWQNHISQIDLQYFSFLVDSLAFQRILTFYWQYHLKHLNVHCFQHLLSVIFFCNLTQPNLLYVFYSFLSSTLSWKLKKSLHFYIFFRCELHLKQFEELTFGFFFESNISVLLCHWLTQFSSFYFKRIEYFLLKLCL